MIFYHKLGDFAILFTKISNWHNYQKFTSVFVYYIKKNKSLVERCRQEQKFDLMLQKCKIVGEKKAKYIKIVNILKIF